MIELKRFVPALGLMAIAATAGIAQSPSTSDQLDQTVEGHVKTISEHLVFDTNNPQKTVLNQQLDGWTDRLEAEVDNYVALAFKADDDVREIEKRLRRVLSIHKPDPELGAPAFAYLQDLPLGRTLIVAYTIIRGVHRNKPTLRAYRWDVDRYRLIAVGGGRDFDGFSVSEAALSSPIRGEMWVLTWGPAQGANGKIVRARILAFDGDTFRTVWAPPEMLNMKPSITTSGFELSYEVRQPPYDIHEQYVLTANGPVQVQ